MATLAVAFWIPVSSLIPHPNPSPAVLVPIHQEEGLELLTYMHTPAWGEVNRWRIIAYVCGEMKKITAFLIFIALTICSFAQTPDWVWAKTSGSISYEYSNANCTDASGNVYIVGTFLGSIFILGNDTLHNHAAGYLDVFIAKYDANGNILWARSGGGARDDWSYGICTDANNNVFIEGRSQSPSLTFDSIIINNSGNDNAFIVKYDSTGNVQWAKNGRGAQAYGWGICSDAAGNVYLYGNNGSNSIIFDNDTLGKGAFIVKYDEGGNVIWAKKIATNLVSDTREQSMCTDLNGNIYITGASQGTAVFGNDTLTGNLTVFVAKYDTSGNLFWVKGAHGTAIGYAIAADANGNTYITGYFGSSVAFGNDTLAGLPFSNTNIFVAKYDSSGNALWGRNPGGGVRDFGQSICTDATGNVFVTGYFISSFLNFGGHPVINANTGYNDAFIAAYDGNGNTLWAKGIGDQGNEYGMGICANAAGDIYVTGYFESYMLNFGSNNVTNNGSADIFLAKLSNAIGINELSTLNSTLLIYPNPSTGLFHISLSTKAAIVKAEVYNCIGEKVFELSGASSASAPDIIDLTKEAAGIYFYSAILRDGTVAKGKLVKTSVQE